MLMVTRQELIGRARELAPVFAARANAEEALRSLSGETVRDLVDSGILATLAPKAYGGHEFGLDTMAEIASIFASACPSTGWISAFYMGASWRTLFYPEQGQKEVMGDKPYVLMAGTAAPLTDIKLVKGGYVASGQTAWSSGCVHADWISFTGLLKGEGGPPTHLTFIVPKHEVEVLDNWFVTGMRATGSNDVRINEVFIPEHRSAFFSQAMLGETPGQLIHANPMYHLPFLPFAMAEVVPVIVGATRGATDAFLDRMQSRQGTISGIKAAGKQSHQMRLGRAMGTARAAEILLGALMDDMTRPLAAQKDYGDRIGTKLRAAVIVDLCRNAINDMARGFGADGFRDSSPLQRYFRDVNMLAVHAFLDIDNATETAGRHALGMQPEDPLV
jgi:3-hydroxy-9,10-secoandrosta-1,3,5(10)-triene-9,17-dione monooxygenase